MSNLQTSQPNYAAWNIQESDYPRAGTLADQIAFLLGYGILAPSTHNTQPWKFFVDKDTLAIRPNLAYALTVADPTGRDLYLSLGACAFNIQVAAAHFGLSTAITILQPTDASAVIRLTFKPNPQAPLAYLFPAITRRSSDKRLLPPQTIPAAQLAALSEATSDKAEVGIISDPQQVHGLGEQYLQSARHHAANPAFALEMASWMRPNTTKSADGMPGFVSGLTQGKAVAGKAAVQLKPRILVAMAAKYRQLIQTSPAAGTIFTPGDTVEDWVQAGMELEAVALKATLVGLTICPLAALVEGPSRPTLSKIFSAKGHPQISFRLAVADATPLHSPRRPPELALDYEQIIATQVGATLHQIRVGPYRINYAVAGSGPALLLIHGANMGWPQWALNIPALAKHFTVYALDLPGSGASTHQDFRQLQFDRDYLTTVTGFIQQLSLSPVAVIGHSFGAAIAIGLALRHPKLVSKLVLMNPLGFSAQIPGKQKIAGVYPVIKLVSRTAMKPTYANMSSFLESAILDRTTVPPEFTRYYHQTVSHSKTSHPLLFMNSLTQGFNFKPDTVFASQLSNLAVPTLLAIGEQDQTIPVQTIYRRSQAIPGVTLKKFTKSAHVPAIDQSQEFNQTVVNFLTKGGSA